MMIIRLVLLTCVIASLFLTTPRLSDAREKPQEDVQSPQVYVIPPGGRDQYEIQHRLIQAVPGDVIQLEEGKYHFLSELNVTCENVTIRGRGSEKTILSFAGQTGGSEGLTATGNGFVIENLAVEDTAGNAIKVLGADGVIFRGVRTEWTGGPLDTNGAYGIYPVQCKNVLIEDCVAIAAADAGIYVGQSQNVIVRRSRAALNVAGIEIENTLNADVYENIAEDNTGGILVFDLPGLQLKNGGDVRVFNNKIINNNTDNFAPKGAMVGEVPPGTGLMIMATDRVEVFDNQIHDNNTAGGIIVSFNFTMRPVQDPEYDPIPEGIFLHGNDFARNGQKPSAKLAPIAAAVGRTFPDIIWDGVANPARLVDGKIPVEFGLVIDEPGNPSFVNLVMPDLTPTNIVTGKYRPLKDLKAHVGSLPAIAATKLDAFPDPAGKTNLAASVYRSLPDQLSGWGLFDGEVNQQQPAEGVIPYLLNTQLFSDYTSKYRFIRLPEGKSMTYQQTGVFDFPVGAVIAKTFSYPHDMRKPDAGERLMETRIEFRAESGWYGVTYIWNEDQTDATLSLGGADQQVTFINHAGEKVDHNYLIPNANMCVSCHSVDGQFVPLGPTAANMNREGMQAYAGVNQLVSWAHAGKLAAHPELENAPQMPVFDDSSTGTLAERARAWLDVNCAHCHNPRGTARTSGLDLSWGQTEEAKFGVWKSPVAAGRATAGRKYDIVPGKPEESILLYRIESNEPGVRMPSLARSLRQEEAVELIHEWISQMPAGHPVTN
ncbi:MAG: right-handed parallel beta-helix repeat-containing protein [Planctomycetaceae bacterium]|nr:right-handed parallel beta-helix repeat-containing protein [Planctomycetaceae bacterium]